MNFKNKFAIVAGSVLLAGVLATGAAFAAVPASSGASVSAPAHGSGTKVDLEQAVKDGKITQGQADVHKQLDALRTPVMEKLQADAKAVIGQAVKDGKITQEQADQMLAHKGGAFGKGGHGGKGGRGGMGQKFQTAEEFKAHLDEEVKAGKHTQEEADALLKRFTEKAK